MYARVVLKSRAGIRTDSGFLPTLGLVTQWFHAYALMSLW